MRVYVYADESGNFDFSRHPKASRYFILTTVTLGDLTLAAELLELRRELAWSGVRLSREFHATEDKQLVRDAVFAILQRHSFRIDVTILEKPKAQPQLRRSHWRFYQYAWFYHMKYVARSIARRSDELLVIAASIGVKRKQAMFCRAIEDVMEQTTPTRAMEIAVWPAAVDPCLQVADYCSWAIQGKWENGDTRSYDLITDKVSTEYNLFASGRITYY